ncbi:hypothetical protein bcgnr5378_05270 [Bacillus cereus]|uniref:Uncharacterized protein n=1 Tax=Bacillus cereus TaxID=1396 RepID=A0A164LDE5_BACCE|nr:hypothetical protein [Bacillus cereus]KZD55692.1 hypothetical protein B4088_5437 [Bacillus cereus]HDR8320203.1 hypothetical protein [Bacillus cereus]HDR8330581.1 hypothetical protein [Bacillus cereus]HDR8338017.1 hypothetical protein [Bacillus cereus]
MGKHIFITYSAERASAGHVDPNFTQLVYGHSGPNGSMLNNHLEVGSYIFFNARLGTQRFITAYFKISKILRRGDDDVEIDALTCDAKDDKYIFIADRNESKVLTLPLVFGKELIGKIPSYEADKAYFDRKEKEGRNELMAISDATLRPHIISEEEKDFLIDLCKLRG